MRSTNRPYLYPVDVLRAGAAVLVLMYHSTQLISAATAHPGHGFSPAVDWPYSRNPIKTILYEGHTGVALFMVLSGFIFTIGTYGHRVSYRSFVANRLLRIYPLFLVLLFIGASLNRTSFTFTTFAQTILPLSSFGGPVAVGGPWGALFWAVAIEFQFYLVFPLLLALLNRLGPLVLVRLIAAMITLRVVAVVGMSGVDINNLFYFSIIGRIDQFLLGMLVAWVYVKHREWLGVDTLIAAGALAVAMLWAFNQLHGYANPAGWRAVWVDIEGGVWALFVGSFTSVLAHRRGRLIRALAAVGSASFSIYLLHFVFVTEVVTAAHHLVVRVGSPLTTAEVTGALVVLPLVLVVSTVTYQSIEKPFLGLRLRYLEPLEEDPG